MLTLFILAVLISESRSYHSKTWFPDMPDNRTTMFQNKGEEEYAIRL